jgi:hypothetical protein
MEDAATEACGGDDGRFSAMRADGIGCRGTSAPGSDDAFLAAGKMSIAQPLRGTDTDRPAT